jgi:Fur family peroxide stress response transcriptional regulator
MQEIAQADRLASFRHACRQHRLRVTPQRFAIYREIVRLKTHPSAEKVFRIAKRRFPDISFDTVNRTLLSFVRIGILDLVEGSGNSRRYDPNLAAHHHLHCVKCGAVSDFNCRAFDRLEIPPEVHQGFTVLGKRVVLQGICTKCSKKK